MRRLALPVLLLALFGPAFLLGSALAPQAQAQVSGPGAGNSVVTRVSAVSTADTDAYLEARVAGTSGGDPKLLLSIPGGTSRYVGIDNSDSDKLKIGRGTAVGTTVDVAIGTTQVGVGSSTFGTGVLQVTGSGTPESTNSGGAIVTAFSAGAGDFFIGRDVTNNVEVTLQSISSGAAAVGTATNHAFAIRTNNTSKLVVNTDGSFYGTALHNVGTPTTAATQYIASGTYTPTLTSGTNVAANTARKSQWMRVGNVVTVSGTYDVDTTSTGASVLGISLPIASDFGVVFDCAGSASATGVADNPNGITASVASDRCEVQWIAVSTANHTVTFSLSYEVL